MFFTILRLLSRRDSYRFARTSCGLEDSGSDGNDAPRSRKIASAPAADRGQAAALAARMAERPGAEGPPAPPARHATSPLPLLRPLRAAARGGDQPGHRTRAREPVAAALPEPRGPFPRRL